MFSGTYPGSMSTWAALQPERVNSDVSNTRGCAAIDTDMLVRQYILGGTQITADGSFCCLSATHPASDMHFLFETGPHYAAKASPEFLDSSNLPVSGVACRYTLVFSAHLLTTSFFFQKSPPRAGFSPTLQHQTGV